MAGEPGERPQCAYCKKPLERVIHELEVKEGQKTPGVGDKVEDLGCVVEVLSTRPSRLFRTRENVRVWFGRWGYRGRGHFCSKTHGWRWGLDMLDHWPEAGD